MKTTIFALVLVCGLLSACATQTEQNTKEASNDDEYVETDYVTGSNIPHKHLAHKMTDEEKARMQDDMNRQMQKMTAPGK